MIFKKKRINHDLFGELTLSGGVWNGSIFFSLQDESILIEIDKSRISEKFESLWTDLCESYIGIKSKLSHVVIKKGILSNYLKGDFSESDLTLETVSIDKDKTYISWGVIGKYSSEAEYEILTEFKERDIEFLGVSH